MPDDALSTVATSTATSTLAVRHEHAFYCFDVLISELTRSRSADAAAASESASHASTASSLLGRALRSSSSRGRGQPAEPASAATPTPPKPNFAPHDASFPLFVTWNIFSATSRLGGAGGGGSGGSSALAAASNGSAVPSVVKNRGTPRLRGCIGTFEAQPLAQGLADYAITSALHDRRFNPITLKEVPRLECGISLLTDFEECEHHLDWNLGEHGIYIHIPPSSPTSRSSSSRHTTRHTLTATYLPEVAPAQGWSKLEAIDSCIDKAGYAGAVDDELRRRLRVQRYRSQKVACTYDDYVAWKQSRGEDVVVIA